MLTYLIVEFVDMLNEMRFGCLTQRSISKFKSLSREIVYDDGLGPTELQVSSIGSYKYNFNTFHRFPRREDVDRSNAGRLGGLDTETKVFQAIDGGPLAALDSGKKLLSNFMAPEKLVLRKNAQVSAVLAALWYSQTNASCEGHVDKEPGRDARERFYGSCHSVCRSEHLWCFR